MSVRISVRVASLAGLLALGCLDVARAAARMHASGAGVREIRRAIEQEYGSKYPSHTPTPAVP